MAHLCLAKPAMSAAHGNTVPLVDSYGRNTVKEMRADLTVVMSPPPHHHHHTHSPLCSCSD